MENHNEHCAGVVQEELFVQSCYAMEQVTTKLEERSQNSKIQASCKKVDCCTSS